MMAPRTVDARDVEDLALRYTRVLVNREERVASCFDLRPIPRDGRPTYHDALRLVAVYHIEGELDD